MDFETSTFCAQNMEINSISSNLLVRSLGQTSDGMVELHSIIMNIFMFFDIAGLVMHHSLYI